MENKPNNCRLCLKASNLLNIFDKENINKNIALVITQHFWFEINEEDADKYVCAVCWSKVDRFHSFYTQVYNIHNDFYPKVHEIIKEEMEDENNLNSGDDEDDNNSEMLDNIPVTDFDLEPKPENEGCDKKFDVTHEEHIEDEDFSDDDNSKVDKHSENNTSDDDASYNEEISDSKKISQKCRKNSQKQFKKDIDPTDKAKMNDENKQIQEYFSMECELCSTTCGTFQSIQFHYRKEHKVKGYLRCCNRKYMERSSLVEHIQRHLNPDTFKCDLCNKIYAHKRGLLEHRERHLSSEEKPFKCTECPKSYTKRFILENHLTTHKTEKKFVCDDCGKAYGTKTLLQAHRKHMHSSANFHICDVCAKEFRSKVVLEQHQKKVHQNIVLPKVQCQVCGIWLKNKHILRKHMIGHEESKSNHFCSICGKKSLNRKALHKHVKTVHSGIVYNCNLCEKTFKKQISLTEHMASHTGAILYSCPHCPKTFNSSGNMYTHKKKVHVKEWEEHERLKVTGVL